MELTNPISSDLPQRSLTVALDFIRDSNLQIVDLNKEVIFNFGTLKAGLEKSGQRLEDFDLLIASTAIENDLVLMSGNLRHFKRIEGLKLA